MTETVGFIKSMQPFLQKAWDKASFSNPTEIQNEAIPVIQDGKDLIAESPTGTGKTLAYLLPLLDRIDSEKKASQILILASSHELVMQIHEEIQRWGEGSGIKSAAFIGGANIKRQVEKLKKHPQMVVGTPGRVFELIKMKKLKMHEMKTIVLDEGDQLLVPEHIGTVKDIIKTTLNERQVILFSATLPEQSVQVANEIMDNPQLIRVENNEVSKANVEHIYFVCEQREKIDVLNKFVKMQKLKALCFVRDIGNLAVLGEKLDYKGVDLGILHSDAKKQDRATTLKDFRSEKFPLLLATDVAARGLDIKNLTHVVHYDLAENKEQYVHRSGRTGRAGASGTVVSIITPREVRNLKKIARDLKISLKKKDMYKGEIIDTK